MTGYIYAVGNDTLVKIGFSQKPVLRARKIKSDTPFPCSLLGYVEGTLAQEAELHSMLVDERTRGEWYSRGRLTDHFISQLTLSLARKQQKQRSVDDAGNPVEIAISYFGTQERAAEAFGVSQPVVNEAKRLGRVGPKLAMGIDRATEGRISKSLLRPDLWPLEIEAAE